MQFIEFRKKLQPFTVFSVADIRNIDPDFHRRRLNDWQDKGYIVKIIKGYYIFSELAVNEKILFEIANRIYTPSYVSFEMALSHYGLIPESVYAVTSVSTLRTYRFKTKIAEFIYHSLRPELFFGYELQENNGKHFRIALPEKAFLDYFYLNPGIAKNDDFASLRINRRVFLKIMNKDRMEEFLKKFGQKSLTKRVKLFLEFIRHA